MLQRFSTRRRLLLVHARRAAARRQDRSICGGLVERWYIYERLQSRMSNLDSFPERGQRSETRPEYLPDTWETGPDRFPSEHEQIL
jgi:hypothetical protein